MSEPVAEPSPQSSPRSAPQAPQGAHEAPSRQPLLVQAAAGLFVGAATSYGAFGAFGPLLGGVHGRGIVVVALLLVGAALAVSAPFRLRGWPAALCGSLAAGALQAVTAAGLLSTAGLGLAAAHGMAAGFALGGALSAAAGLRATGRAVLAGALTLGLLAGTWLYPVPYVPAVLAVIAAGVATAWVRPPGRLTLGFGPLAALMLAVLLTGVVVRSLGTYPFVGFVLLGPIVAGIAAWWLAVPRLGRGG